MIMRSSWGGVGDLSAVFVSFWDARRKTPNNNANERYTTPNQLLKWTKRT